jgi:hypothetical protein
LLALAFHPEAARANDVLVGKFVSESRANFGTDNPGEHQIEITRKGSKYALSMSMAGGAPIQIEVSPCSSSNEQYLQGHPPGETRVLCDSGGGPVFTYSQGGIKSPVAEKFFKAQYYARVGWGMYGFRKIR